MSMLRKTCVGLFAAIALTFPARAAVELETGALPASDLELVVVEAEGCIYCKLFRRDVLPAYEASKRVESVPLRFLDINEVEGGKLTLQGAIATVPTVILLKGTTEVGRIPGYVGPENFFHSVNRLISGAE